MTQNLSHVRDGFSAVRPYVYGPLSLIELVRDAFGAVEVERHAFSATAFHIETRIDDSIIVLEVSDPPHAGGRPGAIYVYVPDVDKAYAKAIALGATPVNPPEDKPYQERGAGVRDSYGNTWWIATFTGR